LNQSSLYELSRALANITAPYKTWYVNPGALSNSPRLAQLIQSGKMNLSLQDAIALALENSMDIVVQRYNPWMADASILKTKACGFGYGVPGSLSWGSTANLPSLIFDPYLTQTISITSALIPVNNPLTSGAGTGTNGIAALGVHQNIYNTRSRKAFPTGTTLNVSGTTRARLQLPPLTSSIHPYNPPSASVSPSNFCRESDATSPAGISWSPRTTARSPTWPSPSRPSPP